MDYSVHHLNCRSSDRSCNSNVNYFYAQEKWAKGGVANDPLLVGQQQWLYAYRRHGNFENPCRAQFHYL